MTGCADGGPGRAEADAGSAAPGFSAWLDRFFAAYFRHRPVNATFIGEHALDDKLPECSEAGVAAMLSDADALSARLQAFPPEALSATDRLDRQLAEGFLDVQRWEARSAQFGFPFRNPTLFTGEAIFGVLGLLLRPFAPLQDRLDRAAARLAATPALLESAALSLQPAPLAWVERARRECTGARLLLDSGIDRLLREAGIERDDVRRAASEASAAFARFDAFLERELLPRGTQHYACGAEALDLLLRRAHFLEVDAGELERLAVETLRAATRADQVQTVDTTGLVSDTQVDAARRCEEVWHAARRLADEADLVTFPEDWPVRFRHPPAWAREAALYLYFLPYRSPAPLDAVQVTECFVPERADEATITLNYVLHHASLGHHVQNWFAARAESRIGRVAAVDCAARIAMLCGGTLAEGWACYSVDLARDTGFLTPAETAEQDRTRRRMAARAIVDIRLHDGRFSLEQAADFYQQHAGMSPGAAHAEAVKNSLVPGAACMYLAGWDGLWRLRRETQAREGRAFSLRAFHDRVLSFGSVPVPLIARAMRASGQVAVHAHR